MAVVLKKSQLRGFVRDVIAEIQQARNDLMRAQPAPILTGDFDVAFDVILLEDNGINAIERRTLTDAPEALITTTTEHPSTTQTTTAEPDTVKETNSGTQESASSASTNGSTSENVNDSQSVSESGSEDTSQNFGRTTQTEVEYKE